MPINKDAIFNFKAKSEPVEAFGQKLYVRAMSGRERDNFESKFAQAKESERLSNIRARLVVLTTVDENGNRVFSDDEADKLGNVPGAAAELDKIFSVASKLNGLSNKDVEELEGN